jgi:hypothetical protein
LGVHSARGEGGGEKWGMMSRGVWRGLRLG